MVVKIRRDQKLSLTSQQHLQGIYVNIYHFVEDVNNDNPVRTFPSAQALRKYMRSNNMIFPLSVAKKSPFLMWFLVKM
jgi:hypothetical protein